MNADKRGSERKQHKLNPLKTISCDFADSFVLPDFVDSSLFGSCDFADRLFCLISWFCLRPGLSYIVLPAVLIRAYLRSSVAGYAGYALSFVEGSHNW